MIYNIRKSELSFNIIKFKEISPEKIATSVLKYNGEYKSITRSPIVPAITS